MKVKSIVLALAALSAGAANAYTDDATNLYLTGASAIRANVAAAVKAMCADADGSLTVYKNKSGVAKLENQMAYVCSVGMAGTGITTVLHTTTGGSLNSILGMSSDAAKQQQPMSFTGCDAAATAGTGDLLGYSVKANCGLDPVAASDGGFSDVEYGPAIEQVKILTTATDGFELADVVPGFTGVAQAFGIAVSEKMYKDLQTAQGIGCTAGDPAPACQPSLSRADIVSLINNNMFAPAKNGAQALGLTSGASVEYVRRPATSGTQTSAQVYFLGKGCLNGENGGQFDVVGNEVATGAVRSYNSGKFIVSVQSGTSDVRNRLDDATHCGNTKYCFGVVSMENRSGTATTGWKFVKLNGVSISDGTSTGLNKANAIAGSYDYFVEAAAYSGLTTDADEGAVLTEISNKMALPVAEGGANTVGLFIIPENNGGYSNADYPTEVGKYQRGGSTPNSCQPVSRPE